MPLLLADTMRAYRIGDPAGLYPIWSTNGDERVSGRWHVAPASVIYASRNYSTALLESLGALEWPIARKPAFHRDHDCPRNQLRSCHEWHSSELVRTERRSGPALWPRLVCRKPKCGSDCPIGRGADGKQSGNQCAASGICGIEDRPRNARMVGRTPVPQAVMCLGVVIRELRKARTALQARSWIPIEGEWRR